MGRWLHNESASPTTASKPASSWQSARVLQPIGFNPPSMTSNTNLTCHSTAAAVSCGTAGASSSRHMALLCAARRNSGLPTSRCANHKYPCPAPVAPAQGAARSSSATCRLGSACSRARAVQRPMMPAPRIQTSTSKSAAELAPAPAPPAAAAAAGDDVAAPCHPGRGRAGPLQRRWAAEHCAAAHGNGRTVRCAAASCVLLQACAAAVMLRCSAARGLRLGCKRQWTVSPTCRGGSSRRQLARAGSASGQPLASNAVDCAGISIRIETCLPALRIVGVHYAKTFPCARDTKVGGGPLRIQMMNELA